MCLVIVFHPPSVVLNPQSDPNYIEALVQELHQTLTITPEHVMCSGAPSSFRFHLGQSSNCLRHETSLLWLILVPLAPPSGSAFILCHSGSAAVFQIPTSASIAWATSSTLVLQILAITLALRLSVFTLGFSSTGSVLPAVFWSWTASSRNTTNQISGYHLKCQHIQLNRKKNITKCITRPKQLLFSWSIVAVTSDHICSSDVPNNIPAT